MNRHPKEQKQHMFRQNLIAVIILIVGTGFSVMIFGPQNWFDEAKPMVNNQTAVQSEMSGKIFQVLRKEGDLVKKDAVIATLDSNKKLRKELVSAQERWEQARLDHDQQEKEIDEQIEQAKNAYAAAQMQFEQIRETNNQGLLAATQKNMEHAKNTKEKLEQTKMQQLTAAKSDINTAEQALKKAQISYEQSQIKAPETGRIIEILLQENDFVETSQTVAVIKKVDSIGSVTASSLSE